MPGEVVIEDVPSSCHRDVGSGTFSGKQATDSEDAMTGHQEHTYQLRLYRDEWARHDEEAIRDGVEVIRDGEEVSGLDNCRRVESVGVDQGNEDGMCSSTCRLFDLLGLCLAHDPCPSLQPGRCVGPIAGK
jgi:hypothetical protein